MSLNDYEIREARKDEIPRLQWLLRDHFYKDEFLLKTLVDTSADLMDVESRRLFYECLLQRHTKLMEANPTPVAVHRPTGRVVGLTFWKPVHNSKLSSDSSTDDEVNSEHIKRLIDIVSRYNEFDVHPDLPDSLRIIGIIVQDEHRRRGLAEGLIKAAIDLGRSKKFAMIEVLCTSPYTTRVAEKLGFSSYAVDDAATIKDACGNLFLPGINSHFMFAMILKL